MIESSTSMGGHAGPAMPPTPAIVEPRDEDTCARAIVQRLLAETGLQPLMEPGSLLVSVGAGFWISYLFHVRPGLTNVAETISRLRNVRGKRFASWAGNKADRRIWFRSCGAPSLHFQIVRSGTQASPSDIVDGHVDVAEPWSHPARHFFNDYLPAHGIGRHPTPREIRQAMAKPRR